MRKITKEIGEAFFKNKQKSIDNTTCTGNEIFLHGNKIVKRDDNGDIWITTAGWPTTTTKERLKFFCRVYTSKGELFLNGQEWDGSWIRL
jgi:hypothetical protein